MGEVIVMCGVLCQQAIAAVGEVIQDYDHDQIFPAYGYGGKLPNGVISHDFNLNGAVDPNCHGIAGILQAYTAALTTVKLWGPTNFAPIIRKVAASAAAFSRPPQLGTSYHVLMILTDGVSAVCSRAHCRSTMLGTALDGRMSLWHLMVLN